MGSKCDGDDDDAHFGRPVEVKINASFPSPGGFGGSLIVESNMRGVAPYAIPIRALVMNASVVLEDSSPLL